jgi:ribosomal protein S18 acetylase RimI-like enzyme
MAEHDETLVRPFDGSLADAKGLLAVEKATFDESPYSATQVQTMLSGGSQRAWLALAGSKVIGFAIAFATAGLSGPCWELDLLAVHPQWRGRRLATRLIRAAAAGSPEGIGRMRAVVATDNGASARAFAQAGFQPAAETCTLLIYRPQEASWRPQPASTVAVQEARSPDEVARWLAHFHQAERPASGHRTEPDHPQADIASIRRPTILLAERDGQPAGYAELIEVQTLLYRGAWIESLVAPKHAARETLVEQVVQRGMAAGWDEVGAMVPEENWFLRNALVAAGFYSLGDFRWLVAHLPLISPPQEAGHL